MATSAQRMKTMRKRRLEGGLRSVRLTLPDARRPDVRKRISEQLARLDPAVEEESMRWIEAVQAEFDTSDE